MERLPRVLPFWMMLLGIVGFFILGVLYFDVRGRETQSPRSPATVGGENVQPLPESTEATDAPTTTEEHILLALPPEVPESKTPSVAAYECWRFDLRGDRIIVDEGYRDLSTYRVPTVNDATLHLNCDQQVQHVIRSPEKLRTLFLLTDSILQDKLNVRLSSKKIYQVDPYSGKLEEIADLPSPMEEPDYNSSEQLRPSMTFTPNGDAVDVIWSVSSPRTPDMIVRVSLDDGDVQKIFSPQVTDALTINPSHTFAIGTEWTCPKETRYLAKPCTYPVFLHRFNLSTGQRVRVGEIFDIDVGVTPIFIDDERVVVAGEDTSAFVMNIYTRATAPIKQITSSLDRLAITTDRSQIVVTGPNQPFTVIPVSELPKP